LNPLLQDPGLIFHPPLLYMGYVGFSVAFAFAIAALLSGRLNPLLQDPGLIFHPPLLYMGYVGFSVAFAFAIA
ncbi:cytochrome c biogenesis protein CcsA, partial [Salmonella enterica]